MSQQLGVGGLTAEGRTFYETQLLMRALPRFAYLNWGLQKDIPARGGNNIQFRRLERPAATTSALVEGTPPASTAVTWVSVAGTIYTYGAYSAFSEVAFNQGIDNILSESTEMWGEHMGDSLDQVARAVLIAGTTVQYSDVAGSRGGVSGPLTEAEVREAVSTLKKNNARRIARAGNRFVAVTHPNAMYDFVGSPSGNLSVILQNAGVRGEANPLFSGDAFDYLGVRFIETSNARVFGSAGLTFRGVFTTLVMGEEFYGETRFGTIRPQIIVKDPDSGGVANPLNQWGTVGWKASLGVVRLNEAFAVRIESGSSLDIQGGN